MKSSVKRNQPVKRNGFWATMTHRKTRGEIIFDFANMIFLIILCLAMIYPFVYMVSVSLSEYELASQVRLFPKGINIEAYKMVFKLDNVRRGYINSFIYVVLNLLIGMTMTTMTAYAMSKRWLPGRKALNIFVLITMYFGGGMVPLYLVITALGMRNTIWALIIPAAIGSYDMIVMRTYFQSSIPPELDESCAIDGATQMQTLVRIYLPLSKPILATIGLFRLVGTWNSWFPASIYLDDASKYPIQLVLRNAMAFAGAGVGGGSAEAIGALEAAGLNYLSVNYALTICVVLPILFIYPFAQKYFIKGVMIGSLKG